MRHTLTATLVLIASGAALAQDLPDGVGVIAPSGSSFTTEIMGGDADDYVFRGFPGMTLTATVKLAKGSQLVPDLQVIAPGGVALTDEDGLSLSLSSKSAVARAVLDAPGWWKVRVRGSGTSTGGYTVGIKYTSPKLASLPTPSVGFKSGGAVYPAGDIDEFRFQGYAGQSISAKLAVPKTSTLDPLVQLVAPNGSISALAGQGTTEKSLTIARSLDADGTWSLRVIGEETTPGDAEHDDATTGPYSLTVKLGKVSAPGLVPDGNRQYRLPIAAVGGATIGYTLSFSGTAPTVNSFVDSTGRPVPGFQGGTSLKSFAIPAALPIGEYVLTFDAPSGTPPANVRFAPTLTAPKGTPKRVAKLSKTEPLIRTNGINPTEGGPGTLLAVQLTNPVDENDQSGDVGLSLGSIPLENVELLPDGITVRGRVPASLPEGEFHVVFYSTTGQPAARADGFRRVPPPTVSDIDPAVGSSAGGYPVTITGGNFRPGHMKILLDGFEQPVTPTAATETTVTFNAPPRPGGFVIFGVKDSDTQLSANLPINSFEYVATPAISRIVPSLIPVLGSELVSIQGANFDTPDTVFVETTTPGVYENMTAIAPTYVNTKVHQFMAPVRPKGVYRVHVQDSQGQPNPPKTRNLTYYSFADITATTNLGSIGGADKYDGWTTAVSDYDKDGDPDLFISRRGDPDDTAAAATSLTRVLRNDGSGQFADVTASVLPVPGLDDWRADRIWLADVNQDTYPDMLITTNAFEVPTAGDSHTRILKNEIRGGGSGPGTNERVFRDRTVDLMAPPRQMQKYGVFGGAAAIYTADDWRGLDMWVGDIDKAAGPPEIVITHDEVKDDDNPHSSAFESGVYCGNYCSSVNGGSSFYNYSFYWGGSRMFVWDKTANKGQGRFKFDPNFFPRKSGPVVPQTSPIGTIPACSANYNSLCKRMFTPFTGKRVSVGLLDSDGKPDVAVQSDVVLQRREARSGPLSTISSLQVGINKFNSADGAGLTDVTDRIFDLGGDTKADVITIGQPGVPDGNSFGVIAQTRIAAPGGGSALRLIKFKLGLGAGEFEDISSQALAATDSNEHFQASQLSFVDTDQDGDQDLVLMANAAPGGTGPALRILRNERVGNTVGNLRRTLDPLFAGAVTTTEHFEGDALSIGDLTGDGLLDYLVTRETPVGTGAQTRIIKTDK